MSYPIPHDALDDRIAIVGTSGSGKTYAAGTAVERLLESGARVVIVDPLDVWYGLRLESDGATPAFPVVIFGGSRADLPISEASGGVIGETVATMAESCIVSLGGFETKASERRFMLSFLERLYRCATGEPFHLIFDEADLWAPQRTTEPLLQSLMEQIVRRGRVKGFIPWLISQRPAVISKDVLSQADGVVTMKLTSKHDRDAIAGWVESTADKGQWKVIDAQLPTLQRGRGIVWIPARDILEETSFPPKSTFDSSRTPKRGETMRTTSLKPIDLGRVKSRLAAIEAEARKPKAARTAPTEPSEAAIAEAYERGYRDGSRELERAVDRAVDGMRRAVMSAIAIPVKDSSDAARDVPMPSAPDPVSKRARRPSPAPEPKREDGSIGQPAQELLAEAERRYPCKFTWVQLAMLCGRKARGGSFFTARKELIDGEYVKEEAGLVVPLRALDRPRPAKGELLEMWKEALPSPANELLAVIAAQKRPITVEELAEATGRLPRGGSWFGAISLLRSNRLVKEPQRGVFALGDLAQ